jgi:alginate O-acetyltransferase complex protein AlgI
MHECTNIRLKKIYLIIAVFLNLSTLIYFKYANFFIENLYAFLNIFGSYSASWINIALPIGISFYTFQSLTYAIDVYRKVHPPLQKPTDYVLYIIMFPQLIAGPIVRFNTVAHQIISRSSSTDDRLQGFYRFGIGLAKKVLLANVFGAFADSVFGSSSALLQNYAEIPGNTLILGILAYTFQIYFDFSGYSDMAIGIGRMIGFTFPENFNNPYVSRSITEFWRRWHITLGAWMKDYLYIPLGGSRVSTKQRLYFNLWIVFLLSGLWHGASWNFILWGAYHGLFLILDRLFLQRVLQSIGVILSTLITFILVVFGWLLFRIEQLDAIPQILQGMAHNSWDTIDYEYTNRLYTAFFCAGFFSWFTMTPLGRRIEQSIFYNTYSDKKHIIMFIIVFILIVLCLGSITTSGFNPFIYFRF